MESVSVFEPAFRGIVTSSVVPATGLKRWAAPIRVAIVDVSSRKDTINNGRVVLINPDITKWGGFAVGREGCMSVPDYTGNVIRAEKITLECLDEMGQRRTYEMEGFKARAAQHEIDHLDGMLFLDRLVSRSGDLFRRKAYKKKEE